LKAIRKTRVRTAEAINIVEKKDSRYPQNALPMRFLENHDEKRSLQVFGPEAIEAYATLLFSLPGLPLIYAGQEIGETQAPSLFEKDTLSWEEADSSLFGMYRELIKMRNQYSCLTSKNFTA
ncbi:MAG: hypothetical protein GWN62_26935, partial [Aliifodinibius sp.]|nr:hypothetical protein [Fodinibius sp.]